MNRLFLIAVVAVFVLCLYVAATDEGMGPVCSKSIDCVK